MKLLKNNATLIFGIVIGMGLMGVFMLGRLSVSADDVQSDTVVTADDEITSQLEFVKEQHKSASDSYTSRMKDFLQYPQQHTTFDRTVVKDYDYTIGGAGLDPIANYIITATKNLPHPYGGLMGLDLAKTWSAENTMFSALQQGPADERGICQLRYKYHKAFMDSQEFFDVYNQVDYCVDVYLDRYNRKSGSQPLANVWTQWNIKDTVGSRFIKL